MRAKNVYLAERDIEWVEQEAEKEARGFSNYLTKLIRDDKVAKDGLRTAAEAAMWVKVNE